ncbi:MAG: hypothetical protein KDD10_28905 [Phaeodactylibacter sp.]|nr:hypothetical protein [Phaeodactylibacter sp.]MCB9294576.1 hypothetical protein [Lewinellaceae bacterium]
MPEPSQDNPITLRLKQLGQQWKAFEEGSDAPFGIWKVRQDASRMIDALVYMEDTEEGVVPSIFLTFESDFENPETYAFELTREFLTHISHPTSRASLEEGGVNIDALEIGEIKDTKAWLQLLADFAGLVEILNGHFVAYLLPRNNESPKEWVKWLERLIQMDIPDQIRIMLKEETQAPLLGELIANYPDRVVVLEPELDMGEAMQEILAKASKGREEEPGVKFQKAMLGLGQAAGQQKMDKAAALAKEALAIASAQGWPHLQVAVLFTLANGYIGIKDYESAIQSYRQAQQAAKEHAEKDAAMGGQLEAQAIIGEAGCYLGRQDFKTGAQTYALAGPIAHAIEKPNIELEAWRMTGFCFHYIKDYDNAWRYYRKALEAGRNVESAMRPSTTLPYVAEALLKLHARADAGIKKYELENEITELLGENWQELLKTTAS